MMPVVRVSDRTWQRLKGYARPLEDTADDVLGRALDALDKLSGGSNSSPSKDDALSKAPIPQRTKKGEKLPQREFREPLLEVLRVLGGRAHVRDIRSSLEPRIVHRLSKADYELVKTGEPRWWNATCWERNELVKAGILRSDSDRGVWELA